jgi:DNA-binding transcriptional LysR family regulator
VLVLAAASFMNSTFLPDVAAACPELRLRALDLPPALIRASASENFFDATICAGTPRLTEAWSSIELGRMRSGLFASPRLAERLGDQPLSPDALRDVPFISAVYSTNGQLASADDDCPLPRGSRRDGHEVQTLELALELAMQADQVVFGPAFAARQLVQQGKLVELQVAGWAVTSPLYFACNIDRVLARQQTTIVQALQKRLALLEAP